MAKAVVLRHDLPDGSFHYDWMIQRPGGPHAPLLTFRTTARIGEPGTSRFEAERLDDHRTLYLTHEGQVSGGRGSVSRVATGVLTVAEPAPGRCVIVGMIGRTEGTFEGRATGDNTWKFTFTPTGSGLA